MKSYTDLEQSKKLAEILPLESADMIYIPMMDIDSMSNSGFFDIPECYSFNEFKDSDTKPFPCWSLAALIELITKVQQGGIFYNLTYDFILSKWTMNIEADNLGEDVGLYDNPVDACYEMIIKLHELNLL